MGRPDGGLEIAIERVPGIWWYLLRVDEDGIGREDLRIIRNDKNRQVASFESAQILLL